MLAFLTFKAVASVALVHIDTVTLQEEERTKNTELNESTT